MVKHPEEMAEWDDLNNYLLADPDNISERHPQKVWWICSKCGFMVSGTVIQKAAFQPQRDIHPFAAGKTETSAEVKGTKQDKNPAASRG